MIEVEVEAIKVFHKENLLLRSLSGDLLNSTMEVHESDKPYLLIFTASISPTVPKMNE